MKRLLSALPFVAAITCLSCSNAPETTEPVSATVAPVQNVSLEVADRAKLEAVLMAQRGNVVLVDYWSTSCVPCVEKLPAVLKLHEQHQARGLRVVTLSMDDPDSSDQIRAFLEQRGATGEHLISKFGASPQSLEEFEIDLVPHYRLYNRAGELVEVFEPGPDNPPLEFASIEAAVERLL